MVFFGIINTIKYLFGLYKCKNYYCFFTDIISIYNIVLKEY